MMPAIGGDGGNGVYGGQWGRAVPGCWRDRRAAAAGKQDGADKAKALHLFPARAPPASGHSQHPQKKKISEH